MVATISVNDPIESRPRKKIHDLREKVPADVHAFLLGSHLPRLSANLFKRKTKSTPPKMPANARPYR
jgi:hypothetical protein